MSTVDLAEQLRLIGRQLQRTERRLTRPSSRLELPAVLQQLLTDPMARLADLLQPFANWPVPRPTADDSAPVSALHRRSPHVPRPPGNAQGEGPWPAADVSSSRDQPQGSAATGEAIRPISGAPEPMDVSSRRAAVTGETQTVSPNQSVRLTREPSGLRSILQANVAQPVEPPVVTALGVARATGRDLPPASGPGHASNTSSAVAHGVPSGVPTMDALPLSVMVANAPDDAATALPRMVLAPVHERTPATLTLDNHLDLPQADIGTESGLQTVSPPSPGAEQGAGGGAGRSAVFPLTPPLSQWERATTGAIGPVAPLTMEPMLRADETFPPEPLDLSHGLNAEQLEQIIDVLVERLELILLRAYGTTGA